MHGGWCGAAADGSGSCSSCLISNPLASKQEMAASDAGIVIFFWWHIWK
jgi:hypothetical protein